jgi:protease I
MTGNPQAEPVLNGRSVLFILPPRTFRDEEFSTPRMLFERSGAQVTVVSSTLTPVTGMRGTIVTPDAPIGTVHGGEFDALLLVGGTGSRAFWHDATVHRMVRDAYDASKVVSAICLAPVTLANAGLLRGRRATAYPSAQGYLEWKGAIYTGAPVETDGSIVTARGPEVAEEFAWTVKRIMVQNNSISHHTS